MAPSPVDKQPAGYKYNWLVNLAMDLATYFVWYVEVQMTPVDAIWLFLVKRSLSLPLHDSLPSPTL